VDALGDIDVLVNNAGTDRFSFFVNSDEDLWDFVLGVNLRGVLAVTHAVLPQMQERRTGAIVNVSSEAGRVGSQGSAVYSAAKAGVIGFTKAIARESARYRVRCNAVAPGPIETPLLNSAPQVLGEIGERLKQGMVNATVMGRSGEPEEVAAAIAFLAGDDASYVTGQTLNVSGGLSMW
jgi:2-hydroxycyclohexanecarboxyl-CoA dehydrogenase